MLEKGVNWNNCPTKYKRGSCCIRKIDETTGRSKWIIDNETPIFKEDGRKYVNDLIYLGGQYELSQKSGKKSQT